MGKTDVVKAGTNKIVAAAYPWAEEIANSISHGIGPWLMLLAISSAHG